MLIIDRSGNVTHISPAAESAIEELGGWDRRSLPTSVLAIATVARSGSGHAETRAKGCSGAWLSLRAALLSGPPDGADVVVTFEPTRRTDLSGLALAARGLTAREAEVAALVQGASSVAPMTRSGAGVAYCKRMFAAAANGYKQDMSEQDLPMTSQPTEAAAKDPDEWKTGDEPMTGAQASYLATLAHDTGRSVPDHLTKAEASKLIDEMRADSPRAGVSPDGERS